MMPRRELSSEDAGDVSERIENGTIITSLRIRRLVSSAVNLSRARAQTSLKIANLAEMATPWLMEDENSIPHLQGHTNKSLF